MKIIIVCLLTFCLASPALAVPSVRVAPIPAPQDVVMVLVMGRQPVRVPLYSLVGLCLLGWRGPDS